MRPNIIFITCHDLGKHLGCYDQATVRSPHLDRLATMGVTFDNSFCTAPQCSPSRAALHTGRYSHANGMHGLAHKGWHLNSGESHLAQRLQDAGYTTTLIGLQHVTESDPRTLGFDHVLPLDAASTEARWAADYLAQPDHQPFYLEIGFFETHRPYDWQGTSSDDALGVKIPPYLPDNDASYSEFNALQGMIHAMDTAVGVILDVLAETDFAKNTWVIFTTDHGLAMPRAKGTLYDPGIETSLIMRWPHAGIQGGKRISSLVSHVDMVPTILDALDLPQPEFLHGHTYWPLLTDTTYNERTAIFAEKSYHDLYDPMRCIRTTNHKLIVNFEHGRAMDIPADVQQGTLYRTIAADFKHQKRPMIELYALDADPNEQINLAGHADYAHIEQDLSQQLSTWMRQTSDPLLDGCILSPESQQASQYLLSFEQRGDHV